MKKAMLVLAIVVMAGCSDKPVPVTNAPVSITFDVVDIKINGFKSLIIKYGDGWNPMYGLVRYVRDDHEVIFQWHCWIEIDTPLGDYTSHGEGLDPTIAIESAVSSYQSKVKELCK